MSYPREWEIVNKHTYTMRLKVQGGWIVVVREHKVVADQHECISMASCFVPDHGHQWILEGKES